MIEPSMKNQLELVDKKQPSRDPWEDILVEHLDFIERQCFNGASKKWISPTGNRSKLELENVSLELFNVVIDKLRENEYEILRKFQKKSKWTTYLTTIIANQLIDLIRRTMGRSRQKERAKKYGDAGLRLYEKVISQGMSLKESFGELKTDGNFPGTFEEFEELYFRIRGNPSGNHRKDESVVRKGTKLPETDEVVVPDNRDNPEVWLLKQNRDETLGDVLQKIVGSLSGEDRMIVRMRFLGDSAGEVKSVDEISSTLGINKKTVYKRISRVLNECKKRFKSMGIQYHDFL